MSEARSSGNLTVWQSPAGECQDRRKRDFLSPKEVDDPRTWSEWTSLFHIVLSQLFGRWMMWNAYPFLRILCPCYLCAEVRGSNISSFSPAHLRCIGSKHGGKKSAAGDAVVGVSSPGNWMKVRKISKGSIAHPYLVPIAYFTGDSEQSEMFWILWKSFLNCHPMNFHCNHHLHPIIYRKSRLFID